MLSKLFTALLAALLIAAGGTYFFVLRPVIQPSSAVLQAEKALSTSNLLAFAELNIKQAVFIERWFLGKPPEPPSSEGSPPMEEPPYRSLQEHFRKIQPDPRKNLDAALFGFYPSAEDGMKKAFVLIGRFNSGAIRGYLSSEAKAKSIQIGNFPAHELEIRSRGNCAQAEKWVVAVDSGWLLASDPKTAEVLLPRLQGGTISSVETPEWHSIRGWDLAMLWIQAPDRLEQGAANGIWKHMAKSATQKAADFQWIYAGAGIRPAPPQARFRAILQGRDAAKISEEVSKWNSAIAQSKARWSEGLPSLGKILDQLQFSHNAAKASVELKLDRDFLKNLGSVFRELIQGIFSGFGISASNAKGSLSAEEKDLIDQNPERFEGGAAESTLPDFDAKQWGPTYTVETSKGPFGFSVESIALSKKPEASLELLVQAVSSRIPNIPKESTLASLHIESVLADGGEVLLKEECGRERNSESAPFKEGFFGSMKAEKTIRLAPGTDARKLKSLSGRAEVSLPTKTETARVSVPFQSQSIEKAGARFTLKSVNGGKIAYQLSGKIENVLSIRALNSKQEPLARQGRMSSSFLFGEGQSVQSEYKGKVEHLEVVFATETKNLRYPFTLTDFKLKRPSSSASTFAPKAVEPAPRPYTYENLVKDFSTSPKGPRGRRAPRVWSPPPPPAPASPGLAPSPPLAIARIEPFELVWKKAQAWFRTYVRFEMEIRSPLVPIWKEGVSAGEISLTEVVLKNGTRLHPPAPQPSDQKPSIFQVSWNSDFRLQSLGFSSSTGLESSPSFTIDLNQPVEEARELRGSLRFYFPKRLQTLVFSETSVGTQASANGAELTITERKRDQLTFRLKTPPPSAQPGAGAKVFAIRLYGEGNQPISISSIQSQEEMPGEQTLRIGNSGNVERAELHLAPGIEIKEYPFVLVRP